jgi:cytochrome c oxidase cbb3-type subunit 3
MPQHLAAVALLVTLLVAACDRVRGDSTTSPAPVALPTDEALNAVPLGAPPGQAVSVADRIANPRAGDAQAAAEGEKLFASMNCVYCHGAHASGLMGPPLNGSGWRYGGTPSELYNSIHDGRPQGMPAWGVRLPPDQIWKLVAYLQTLENASGQPSTTGPQAADQSPADSAHQGLIDAQRGG